jgi:RNA polymerase sigma factor (sigma-70 family)
MMSNISQLHADIDIINGIIAGGTIRRQFENKLYNKYSYMIREASFKHKLNEEQASIAYSDSILSVIEHIANGRFEGRSELKTYIFQIFSNKCVDAMRRNATKHMNAISIDEVLDPIPDSQRTVLSDLIRNQDHERLTKYIDTLVDRCQVLLRKWSEGYTDNELAIEYNYSTAAVAQTTRLRCIEKLKEMYKINRDI